MSETSEGSELIKPLILALLPRIKIPTWLNDSSAPNI